VAPLYHRSFTPGHLQFITTRNYRRTPLFRNEGLGREFVSVLAALRRAKGIAMIGWVLMPDRLF
jgi:REP element-mobilizing transposase RayT